MKAPDGPRVDDARPRGVAPDGLRAPVGESALEASPALASVECAVDPAAGGDPDVSRIGAVQVPGVDRGVQDHPFGDPGPGDPAVSCPERLTPGAREERF